MITNEEYMQFTRSTAIYPKEKEIEYLTLGLCGECGEVANKVKKLIRDSKCVLTPELKESIIFECSDAIWYLTRLTDALGLTMEELMEVNRAKLTSRKERGVIGGSGDNR